MANTPRNLLPLMSSASEQQFATYSAAMSLLDPRLNPNAISQTNTPPGSPAEGDMYIIGSSPTGAWAGNANKLAYYVNAAWIMFTPTIGVVVWNADTERHTTWDGSAWRDLPGYSGFIFSFFSGPTPDSDEVLFSFVTVEAFDLTAGLTASRAISGVAADASFTLSIKKNGSEIGTINWSAAGTVGTFTLASTTSFVTGSPGDIFSIVAPFVVDADIANIAVSIVTTRP